MAKTGALPLYLYSNKISEVAKATEVYLADVVRSSKVEKEVLKLDWATWNVQSGEYRGRASRSIWLCKWSWGWFAANIDQ